MTAWQHTPYFSAVANKESSANLKKKKKKISVSFCLWVLEGGRGWGFFGFLILLTKHFPYSKKDQEIF